MVYYTLLVIYKKKNIITSYLSITPTMHEVTQLLIKKIKQALDAWLGAEYAQFLLIELC